MPPIVPAAVGVRVTDIAVLFEAPAVKLVIVPLLVVSCVLAGVPKLALRPSWKAALLTTRVLVIVSGSV